jgi:GAF domain-containing protein
VPARAADVTGEQDQRLAHAFEAVQDLYFLDTPAAGLDFVVKLLGEVLPSEGCAASLYDINTDQLHCVVATGQGANARRARGVSSATGLAAVAAKGRNDHLVVNAVAEDARFVPDVDGFGDMPVRDLAYFPLSVGIQLVGMLQLVNRTGRAGFSDADVAVGAYVAGQAAKFVIDHRNRRHG